MAPLLRTYFAPKQRSLLSTLFTATFLGAVVVVAFPCPARPGDRAKPTARLDSPSLSADQVVVVMNSRGKHRFMEER
ncbi:hypothetical protein DB88DRAFT_489983 [Papiliotrema laurentii]|uniref:Uncharacterized protein n=1 Tax=Papiliotrema laurentii TaxID=5418 RepID=A0AAD9CYC2_PAPLA|nr:hypothetical protein DB88DRAFT_489983 [Papiliotrema laurentii]